MTAADQKILDLEAELASVRKRFAERERELEEQRLKSEESDAAKATFLATLSHELRTPLNAIIGFSELMHGEQLGPVGTEQYKVYLKDIMDSGMHLLSLVDDLLNVSRMQTGKVTFQDKEVDPVELIKSVARLLGPEARNANVRIDVRLSPNLGMLFGDERALRQTLINIVGNAIRYTTDGGHVVVSATVDGSDRFVLTVNDTGMGIAKDKIGRVFEPFFQGSSVLSRSHGGAGLGLAIAKSMVDYHDGEIALESEEGVGTSVTITLPTSRVILNDPEDDMTQFDDDDDEIDLTVCLTLSFDDRDFTIYQDGGEFIIGRPDPRQPDLICDLPLMDTRISRPHARIVNSHGHFYLIDQSRRGTFVQAADGQTEFVQQNSSGALDDTGMIILGEAPGDPRAIRISYRLCAAGAETENQALAS